MSNNSDKRPSRPRFRPYNFDHDDPYFYTEEERQRMQLSPLNFEEVTPPPGSAFRPINTTSTMSRSSLDRPLLLGHKKKKVKNPKVYISRMTLSDKARDYMMKGPPDVQVLAGSAKYGSTCDEESRKRTSQVYSPVPNETDSFPCKSFLRVEMLIHFLEKYKGNHIRGEHHRSSLADFGRYKKHPWDKDPFYPCRLPYDPMDQMSKALVADLERAGYEEEGSGELVLQGVNVHCYHITNGEIIFKLNANLFYKSKTPKNIDGCSIPPTDLKITDDEAATIRGYRCDKDGLNRNHQNDGFAIYSQNYDVDVPNDKPGEESSPVPPPPSPSAATIRPPPAVNDHDQIDPIQKLNDDSTNDDDRMATMRHVLGVYTDAFVCCSKGHGVSLT